MYLVCRAPQCDNSIQELPKIDKIIESFHAIFNDTYEKAYGAAFRCLKIHYRMMTNSQVKSCTPCSPFTFVLQAKELGWDGETRESLDKVVQLLESLDFVGIHSEITKTWPYVFTQLISNEKGMRKMGFKTLFASSGEVSPWHKSYLKRSPVLHDLFYMRKVKQNESTTARAPIRTKGDTLIQKLEPEQLNKVRQFQWADIYVCVSVPKHSQIPLKDNFQLRKSAKDLSTKVQIEGHESSSTYRVLIMKFLYSTIANEGRSNDYHRVKAASNSAELRLFSAPLRISLMPISPHKRSPAVMQRRGHAGRPAHELFTLHYMVHYKSRCASLFRSIGGRCCPKRLLLAFLLASFNFSVVIIPLQQNCSVRKCCGLFCPPSNAPACQ